MMMRAMVWYGGIGYKLSDLSVLFKKRRERENGREKIINEQRCDEHNKNKVLTILLSLL
jgi:hypothetical protein